MHLSRAKRNDVQIVDSTFAAACQAARANKEQCPYGCMKLLSPRTIDFHRLNGCRGRNEDAFADLSKKRSFTCGVCSEEFVTRDAFFNHLNAEHDIHPSIHTLVFPDYHTFNRFRFWLEAQGGAHFRQKSGAKARPNGKGIFMMCNRSGLVHTTAATGVEGRDKIGQFRTGYTCTAFINGVLYPDGHVTARFCGDHYGHDARMRLPQSVKNIIMHKHMEGLSNIHIIRYLQHHFMPHAYDNIHAQRVALVDADEIRALAPVARKLSVLPYEKEEEWEQELLELAGVRRDYAPAWKKPDNFVPIDVLAKSQNWPLPITFTPKHRGPHGEWMIYNDDGILVPETEQKDPRDAMIHAYEEEVRDTNFVDSKEIPADGDMVDVEEMDDGVNGERPGPSRRRPHSEMSGADPSFIEYEKSRNDREEEEERIIRREDGHDRNEHNDNTIGTTNTSRGFVVDTIMNELDMIKALVKTDPDYFTQTCLNELLAKIRVLRQSFDPVTVARSSTSASVRDRGICVPQLNKVAKIRSKVKSVPPLTQSRVPYTEPKTEMTEIDSGDEDIVVGSTSSSKIHYNSRLWS